MVNPITRDFSKKREPIYFTIDDERFDCHKAMPLESLGKLVAGSRNMTAGATEGEVDANALFDRILPVVKALLRKESYKRFIARIKPPLDDEGDIIDEDNWEPIDHLQLMEAIKWAVEVYTKDPSQSSQDSSSGSESAEPGSSSTVGVLDAVSIPLPSTASGSLV